LNDIKRSDLAGMSREQLEELAWRLHELARLLANRAGEDSSTSSRPPSSDNPYRRQERGKPVAADSDGAAAESSDTAPEKAGKPDKNRTAKGSGKQPGAKGHWRCQPIVVSREVAHAPMVCAACGAALGPDLKRRCVSAHDSLELVRGDMALQVTATRHSYFAVRCPCGDDNVERPRVGLSSLIEGRKRASDYSIALATTPQPFGGRRWWFRCPRSGDLVGKLHLPDDAYTFASQRAHRLGYSSQRETPSDRATSRAFKLRERLGGKGAIGSYVPKPKWMRWSTYAHEIARVEAAEEIVEAHISAF